MEKIKIDSIPGAVNPATVKRGLTEPLNTTNMALNYYELAPGDSFAYGYHMHGLQEEVFVIQSGTVTFETENGDVEVSANEVIRFAPGEYQQGTNRGDERVIAFAIGAPRERGEGEILRECESCDERTPHSIKRVENEDARTICCDMCGGITERY